jgi:uncharacterized protein YukE
MAGQVRAELAGMDSALNAYQASIDHGRSVAQRFINSAQEARAVWHGAAGGAVESAAANLDTKGRQMLAFFENLEQSFGSATKTTIAGDEEAAASIPSFNA